MLRMLRSEPGISPFLLVPVLFSLGIVLSVASAQTGHEPELAVVGHRQMIEDSTETDDPVLQSARIAQNSDLTLEAAIEFALANNPGLRASRSDAEASHARSIQARGAGLPHIGMEATASWFEDDKRLLFARYGGEPGIYGDQLVTGDLVLNIPLYAGGRLKHEWSASRLLAESSDFRFNRFRDELIYNVTTVFYTILAQEKRIGALEFSDSTLVQHQSRVNELIQLEKAAVVDRMRIEVRKADVRQRLIEAKNMRDLQLRLLENLMGFENFRPDMVVTGDLETISEYTEYEGREAWSEAEVFTTRPDLLAAQREVEALKHRMTGTRSVFLPSLSLVGAYGSRWMPSPRYSPAGLDNPEMVGQAGLKLSFPIFQGGQNQARWEENKLRYDSARYRFEQLKLQVAYEVESARSTMETALERLQMLESALELAREGLRIEQEKHLLGRGTVTDVLDAQSTLMELEASYYDNLANYHTAHARLVLASGGTTE